MLLINVHSRARHDLQLSPHISSDGLILQLRRSRCNADLFSGHVLRRRGPCGNGGIDERDDREARGTPSLFVLLLLAGSCHIWMTRRCTELAVCRYVQDLHSVGSHLESRTVNWLSSVSFVDFLSVQADAGIVPTNRPRPLY
jgi:hypothetical protein